MRDVHDSDLDSLSIEWVLGQTCSHNNAFGLNPITGDVAYAAGNLVVVYQISRNCQSCYFQAQHAVSSLCYSMDGTLLAIGEKSSMPFVTIYDSKKEQALAKLSLGHKYDIACMTFSKNKRFLVTVGGWKDLNIQVWDINSAIAQYSEKVNDSLLKDSKSLIVAFAESKNQIYSIDFSNDGCTFATVGEGHVTFWHFDANMQNKAERMTKLKHTSGSALKEFKSNTFIDVAYYKEEDSSNCLENIYCVTTAGFLCMFSSDKALKKWICMETKSAFGLSVSSGIIAVACSNGLIRLFQTESLKYIATLPKPPPIGQANVTSILDIEKARKTVDSPARQGILTYQHASTVGVRISPMAKYIIAIYSNRSFFVWDISDVKKIGIYRSFLNHSSSILDAHLFPRNSNENYSNKAGDFPIKRLVTSSADKTLCLWNLSILDPTFQMAQEKQWTNIYSKVLERVLYINSADGICECTESINSSTEGYAFTESGTARESQSLTIHPSGSKVAYGDDNGIIRIYNMETMTSIQLETAFDGKIIDLCYSPVITQSCLAKNSNLKKEESIPDPPYLNQTSACRALVKDESFVLLASAGSNSILKIFESRDKIDLLQSFDICSLGSVVALKFSKDGCMLIVSTTNSYLILYMVRGRHVLHFKTIHHTLRLVQFEFCVEPTNRYIVTVGKDSFMHIWSLLNGKHIRAYKLEDCMQENFSQNNEIFLYKVEVDPSGIYAAVSFRNFLTLYDFFSGTCLAKQHVNEHSITSISFSGDGSQLISTNNDGCIIVWRLNSNIHMAIRDRLEEISSTLTSISSVSANIEGTIFEENCKNEQALGTYLKLQKSKVPIWAQTKYLNQAEDINFSGNSLEKNESNVESSNIFPPAPPPSNPDTVTSSNSKWSHRRNRELSRSNSNIDTQLTGSEFVETAITESAENLEGMLKNENNDAEFNGEKRLESNNLLTAEVERSASAEKDGATLKHAQNALHHNFPIDVLVENNEMVVENATDNQVNMQQKLEAIKLAENARMTLKNLQNLPQEIFFENNCITEINNRAEIGNLQSSQYKFETSTEKNVMVLRNFEKKPEILIDENETEVVLLANNVGAEMLIGGNMAEVILPTNNVAMKMVIGENGAETSISVKNVWTGMPEFEESNEIIDLHSNSANNSSEFGASTQSLAEKRADALTRRKRRMDTANAVEKMRNRLEEMGVHLNSDIPASSALLLVNNCSKTNSICPSHQNLPKEACKILPRDTEEYLNSIKSFEDKAMIIAAMLNELEESSGGSNDTSSELLNLFHRTLLKVYALLHVNLEEV